MARRYAVLFLRHGFPTVPDAWFKVYVHSRLQPLQKLSRQGAEVWVHTHTHLKPLQTLLTGYRGVSTHTCHLCSIGVEIESPTKPYNPSTWCFAKRSNRSAAGFRPVSTRPSHPCKNSRQGAELWVYTHSHLKPLQKQPDRGPTCEYLRTRTSNPCRFDSDRVPRCGCTHTRTSNPVRRGSDGILTCEHLRTRTAHPCASFSCSTS